MVASERDCSTFTLFIGNKGSKVGSPHIVHDWIKGLLARLSSV